MRKINIIGMVILITVLALACIWFGWKLVLIIYLALIGIAFKE